MPLDTAFVDHRLEGSPAELESRWTMNYAAGVLDGSDCYYATAGPQAVIAHPLHHTALEWPLTLQLRRSGNGLTADERHRAVHAAQDLVLHRPLRAGDVLVTEATVVGADRPSPGARLTVRFRTFDQHRRPVALSTSTTIFRGVEITGPPRPDQGSSGLPPVARGGDLREDVIEIPVGAAHAYSECSRIFNPIHTDQAVARRAGLPDTILHGSATLAMAVTNIVRHEGQGRSELVGRVAGRFRAPVGLPAKVRLRAWSQRSDGPRTVSFSVLNQAGEVAIEDGLVQFRD